MKIKDFLAQDCIKLNLQETEKIDHIVEMVEVLVKNKRIDSKKAKNLISGIMEREEMGSTGIGEGVAIPHVKTEYVKSILGVLGISKNGIEFNSLDGGPVFISFLLLTPIESRTEHLTALSEISLFLKDKYYREELQRASDDKQAYKIIKKL